MNYAYIIWYLRDGSIRLEKLKCDTMLDALDIIEKVMRTHRRFLAGIIAKFTSRILSNDEEDVLLANHKEVMKLC